MAATKPKLPRGRPPKDTPTQRLARKSRQLEQKITDLFTHRHLAKRVRRQLTASERQTLQSIARGLPHLRTLRAIMDEVYCLPAPVTQARVFDRRCCTDTALAKLARLRARVQRFQQVGKTDDTGGTQTHFALRAGP